MGDVAEWVAVGVVVVVWGGLFIYGLLTEGPKILKKMWSNARGR
jgi:hypothetical protein